MVKWGESGKGRDLYALELYAGKAPERDRPCFKYVGNVHGDEVSDVDPTFAPHRSLTL